MAQEKSRPAEDHRPVEMTERGLIIPALVVIVGQACSLKCKNCAKFSPYAPNETRRYSLKRICEDLNLIFQSCHYLRRVQVQGGEPFLYTELPELLDFIRDSGKAETITVATNGTIFPDEKVFQALKRNHVRVRISHYPDTPQDTVERLMERLTRLNLDTWKYEFALDDSMWYDMGGIKAKPEADSDEAVARRFQNCPFHDCFTLENGKISRCSRAVIAELVQGFTANSGDYLPVVPTEDFPDRLWEYLRADRFMEACRFCYGSEGDKILPALQL